MAKIRVGINGFGRIGRVLFRQGFKDVEIVGINSLDSLEGSAHLLKFDSTHGRFSEDVQVQGSHLIVGEKKINYSSSKNPADIPWKNWNVDVVLECTGAMKGKEDYSKHIQAGAKKVFISAPAEQVDETFVYGINHENYSSQKHTFFSNASCTTNCLAPLAAVLQRTFGIEHGLMTTIHSYTNDQRILDASHKDLRRARSAALSMIPTTTGAAKAVGLVLPELKGKIDGISIRVPTPNVSLVDLTFRSSNPMTVASIHKALEEAAQGFLRGVLAVEKRPLVSTDFNGDLMSCTVDSSSTMLISPHMAKVFAWYDNETGFSCRMIDMIKYIEKMGI
jgi:glyceraldehyde 3-phosphate dehydrogenase